jgi:hypothetical protein
LRGRQDCDGLPCGYPRVAACTRRYETVNGPGFPRGRRLRLSPGCRFGQRQLVPDPRDGPHHLGVLAECAPQPEDRDVDAARIHRARILERHLHQLFPAEDLTGVLTERDQHPSISLTASPSPSSSNNLAGCGEQLARDRDLRHLKGDVPAVADDLRADLDQLLAQRR